MAHVLALSASFGMLTMLTYRCYFLDCKGHIRAAKNFEADTLIEAIDRARQTLPQRPHYHSIEIWQDDRRLYPISC
jgi:hypothetical protein